MENVLLLTLLGLFSVYIDNGRAYVLVQVRKGDNHSDVDALIHREVPSDKVDVIAHNIARKANFKRFEVRKRLDMPKEDIREQISDVMSAIDVGINGNDKDKDDTNKDVIDKIEVKTSIEKQEGRTEQNGTDTIKNILRNIAGYKGDTKRDGIDKIEHVIRSVLSPYVRFGPIMRAKEVYNIEPKMLQFRNGEQTLMVDVKSSSVIKAIKDFLSSKAVRSFADDLAQKAAAAYQSKPIKKYANELARKAAMVYRSLKESDE